MSENKSFYEKSMDEIVFENRNQSYGAYVFRKIQSSIQLRALIIISFLFILFSISPKILQYLDITQAEEIPRFDTTAIRLLAPPTVNHVESLSIPEIPQEIEKTIKPPESEIIVPDKNPITPITKSTGTDTSGTAHTTGSGDGSSGSDNSMVYNGNWDIPPSYKYGEDALDEFLKNNTNYPKNLESKGIEGVVTVTFIIETDGSISNIAVKGKNDKDMEAEAVRVIKLTSGNWNPCKKRKMPVRSICAMPIVFEIH